MVSLGRHISLWKKDERSKLLSSARPVFRTSHFDIKILPRQAEIARLMVITPKKVGSAPYRNLVKRRARSIFYQEKLYNSTHDWVIYFRPAPTPLTYQKLLQILLKLFKEHA